VTEVDGDLIRDRSCESRPRKLVRLRPKGGLDRVFRHYAGVIPSFSPSPLCATAVSVIDE